ncbi:MAG: PTS sugar transporter subunit IIA [Candidatus Cloacimonetes bacterium]|nr:PTS sugar transporter subunit IIA [Candidatus Cloacimonadota bacterium]
MSVFEPGLVRRIPLFGDKAECLKRMVGWLHEKKALDSRRAFLQDLMARERIMPTGVGRGVAMPHARSAAAQRFCVAVCVLEQPLDWQSLDGKPVRIVILAAVPNDAGDRYMRFMQQVSEFCRHEENRKALLLAETDDTTLDILTRMETDKR